MHVTSLSRESLVLQQHRGDADIYKLLGNAVFLKNMIQSFMQWEFIN